MNGFIIREDKAPAVPEKPTIVELEFFPNISPIDVM